MRHFKEYYLGIYQLLIRGLHLQRPHKNKHSILIFIGELISQEKSLVLIRAQC